MSCVDRETSPAAAMYPDRAHIKVSLHCDNEVQYLTRNP